MLPRDPERPLAAALACLHLLASPATTAAAAPRTEELAELTVEELLATPVDVVTSASKHEEPISRAPASVAVITGEEIRVLGHRTLAHVLDGVRGFFTTDDRNYARAAVRGLGRPGDYGTRVLLLVDGHQLNDSLYDTAFIGNDFPIDLELVERIEVVRGPGSALYGGNAMFAVVNVVTREVAGGGTATAAVAGGSFGARRARAEYSRGATLLSLSAYDSAGPTIAYPEYASTPSGGVARGLDWERGGRALAKASLGGLRLLAGAGLREKGIPTGAFGVVFADRRARTSDLRAFAEAAWEGDVAPSLRASARAYADEYRYVGQYPFASGPDRFSVYEDDHVGRWFGSEGRLRFDLVGRAALTVGGEARLHLRQAMSSGTIGEVPDLDVLRTPASGAAYAEVDLSPARWLDITVGARWDAHADLGGRASPRAAIVVEPRGGTTLKLLSGEAYRPPNLYERFYWAASPDQPFELRPEVIRMTELVLEQSAWRGARLSASAYRWELDDLLTQTVDGAGELAVSNEDGLSARGLEVELEQRLTAGAAARASWSLQRTRDDDGRELTNSPRHLGKL